MGKTFETQGCRGYLGLHEAKTWLAAAFGNEPGGGMEDLNQIMDHDLKKTQPGQRDQVFTAATHTWWGLC